MTLRIAPITPIIISILLFASLFCTPVAGQDFRRGDVDGDGIVDGVTDGGFILNNIPSFTVFRKCIKAWDADDSGSGSIIDGLFILNSNFSGTVTIPLPGISTCGPDPTADTLGCNEYDCSPYMAPAPDSNFSLSISDIVGEVGENATVTVELKVQGNSATRFKCSPPCSQETLPNRNVRTLPMPMTMAVSTSRIPSSCSPTYS